MNISKWSHGCRWKYSLQIINLGSKRQWKKDSSVSVPRAYQFHYLPSSLSSLSSVLFCISDHQMLWNISFIAFSNLSKPTILPNKEIMLCCKQSGVMQHCVGCCCTANEACNKVQYAACCLWLRRCKPALVLRSFDTSNSFSCKVMVHMFLNWIVLRNTACYFKGYGTWEVYITESIRLYI
jgi:hypothetical protein